MTDKNQYRITLLDGPSASGKSGAKQALMERVDGLTFCPRITTRPPREEESDSDYRFVSPQEFQDLEDSEGLAAWRHFEFGMSYGLPIKPVEQALALKQRAFCLIDLGTVEQAKACWPQATGILLYAPLDQLERRLRARHAHSEEQIAERLRNAERVWVKRHLYDHVIINEDGEWEHTLAQLQRIVER